MLRLTSVLRSALLLTACFAGAVHADEGETSIGLLVQPEFAWVSHPLTGELVPFAPTSSFTFLPRIGGNVRYGLTDSFSLGLGLDGSLFGGLVAKGVTMENTVGDLATGTRLDVMMPLSVTWRLDSGADGSLAIELSGGPCVVGWLASKGLNPALLGENGLATELPVVIKDEIPFGGFARLGVMFNGRLLNWLVLDAGVSVTAAYADTAALHLGLLLRPSFVLPLGQL